MTLRTTWSRLTAFTLALLLALAGSAAFALGSRAASLPSGAIQPVKKKNNDPHTNKAAKKKAKPKVTRRAPQGGSLREVPPELSGTFSILRAPATGSIPSYVQRLATSDPQDFGLDATQTRQLTVGQDKMWVLPGSKGLCLSGPEGTSACASTDVVTQRGVGYLDVPAPQGPVKPGDNPFGPGVTTWHGLAPDGYTGITGTTQSGKTVVATINGNGYVMRANEPIFSALLTSAEKAPIRIG